jgi:thymidylate synthase
MKNEFLNFQPVQIVANDLNDAYFQLLTYVYNYGRKYKIDTGSFAGAHRLEFDSCSGFIKYPHTRPLAPIMPQGIPPTTTDDELDKYFANYLMDADLEDNEHYRYSSWINGIEHYHEFKYHVFSDDKKDFYKTINIENNETPLEWVIRHFQEKGYGNNHCYINVGNVDSGFNYDIPYDHEAERRTSPCLRGIDFKIKDNYLIMSVIFRSWDLYAGFPENMGGMTLLNEYVAEQLDGVKPGPLAFTSAGLHAYDYQIDPIMTILKK